MSEPPMQSTKLPALPELWREFPALTGNGAGLVYLDNASTTQRPGRVLDAMIDWERGGAANPRRGLHRWAQNATAALAEARRTVQRFLGAADAREIVFVRGTTEAINLVAFSHGRQVVQRGDRVVATELEHHSNLVPWQMLCAERGAELCLVPIDAQGNLDMAALRDLVDPRTRLVACTATSNVLGTEVDVRAVAEAAHRVGATLVVDAAQAIGHRAVDVRAWDADFVAFSGHKVYGPMGIGVLWGRQALFAAMPPWQGGGEMISSVEALRSSYAAPPERFEAGTHNLPGVIGLAAALRMLQEIGLESIIQHERRLTQLALQLLSGIPGLRIVGEPSSRSPILCLDLPGRDAHEVAALLDAAGIAVRSGHHCAQPLHRRLGLDSSVRVSFAAYSRDSDVERLAEALRGIT